MCACVSVCVWWHTFDNSLTDEQYCFDSGNTFESGRLIFKIVTSLRSLSHKFSVADFTWIDQCISIFLGSTTLISWQEVWYTVYPRVITSFCPTFWFYRDKISKKTNWRTGMAINNVLYDIYLTKTIGKKNKTSWHSAWSGNAKSDEKSRVYISW